MSSEDLGFEGTWRVVVGLRKGAGLEIREENDRYMLKDGADHPLHALELDDVAFTLRGESTCLSLWQDSQYLFGIEIVDNEQRPLRVWGAERVSGAPKHRSLHANRPGWRVGMPWIIRDTSGEGLPVELNDQIQIEIETEDFLLFKKPEPEPFDTLRESDLNRTLDGATRSVALWQEGPRAQSYLFSMVVTPQEVLDEIREMGVGKDFEAVKKILSERLKDLLPFEIVLLAIHITEDHSSVAVWGADEG